jgi:hypothetical protein
LRSITTPLEKAGQKHHESYQLAIHLALQDHQSGIVDGGKG